MHLHWKHGSPMYVYTIDINGTVKVANIKVGIVKQD